MTKATIEISIKAFRALEALTGYVESKIDKGDMTAPREHTKDARNFLTYHYNKQSDPPPRVG